MRTSSPHVVLAGLMLVAGAVPFVAYAQSPATKPASDAGLGLLEPLVGSAYTIDTTWKSGEPLKARETWAWGIGKKFILCDTFLNGPDGTEYHRYQTIFGIQEGKLVAHSFTFDGTYEVLPATVEGKVIKLEGGKGGMKVHQTLDVGDINNIGWTVKIARDGGEPREIMNGVWKRA